MVGISANVTADFGQRDRRRWRASAESFRYRDRPFRRSWPPRRRRYCV